PLFDRSGELALFVPPFTVGTTAPAHWGAGHMATGDPAPSGDACIRVVTGHLHERGRYVGVDVVGPDDQPPNPPGGVTNPFDPSQSNPSGAVDHTDPGARTFVPALLVHHDEALRYACRIDNGVTTPVRLGCEEQAGVAPGTPAGMPGGGPAKPC